MTIGAGHHGQIVKYSITHTHSQTPLNQTPETAVESAHRTTNAVEDVTPTGKNEFKARHPPLKSKVEEGFEQPKDFAQHAGDATNDPTLHAADATKDIYQSVKAMAKKYVRQYPIPIAICTLIASLTFGYMVGRAQWKNPTLSHRHLCGCDRCLM